MYRGGGVYLEVGALHSRGLPNLPDADCPLDADPSWRQIPWIHTSQWKQIHPGCRRQPHTPPPPDRCWIETPPLGGRPPTLLEANPPRTCDLWCMVGSQPHTQTHPNRGQKEWHTSVKEWHRPVKILPCPKLRLQAVKIFPQTTILKLFVSQSEVSAPPTNQQVNLRTHRSGRLSLMILSTSSGLCKKKKIKKISKWKEEKFIFSRRKWVIFFYRKHGKHWRIRDFPDGGANPEGRGANLLFGLKNAWKWKKFDR